MLIIVTNKKRNTYKYRKWLYDLGLRFSGRRWTLNTDDNSLANSINSFCRKNHLDISIIPDNYVRGDNYRKDFFNQYGDTDKFRCAYCGKHLTKKTVTIDHILPVQKVQHGTKYRFVMKILGIENINDFKNLTPCCERCNKKKHSKFNLKYYLLGTSGKYPSNITFRRIIKFICLLAILFDVFLIGLLLIKISGLPFESFLPNI